MIRFYPSKVYKVIDVWPFHAEDVFSYIPFHSILSLSGWRSCSSHDRTIAVNIPFCSFFADDSSYHYYRSIGIADIRLLYSVSYPKCMFICLKWIRFIHIYLKKIYFLPSNEDVDLSIWSSKRVFFCSPSHINSRNKASLTVDFLRSSTWSFSLSLSLCRCQGRWPRMNRSWVFSPSKYSSVMCRSAWISNVIYLVWFSVSWIIQRCPYLTSTAGKSTIFISWNEIIPNWLGDNFYPISFMNFDQPTAISTLNGENRAFSKRISKLSTLTCWTFHCSFFSSIKFTIEEPTTKRRISSEVETSNWMNWSKC